MNPEVHSSTSANTSGGSYEHYSEDLAQDKFIDRVNVYFFDTLECWRQQGWPHRGLGLGFGSAEAMQGRMSVFSNLKHNNRRQRCTVVPARRPQASVLHDLLA